MVELMGAGQFLGGDVATTMASRTRGPFLAGGTPERGEARFAGVRRAMTAGSRVRRPGVMGGFRGMFR